MKIIKIAQCYFCPSLLPGHSTDGDDVGYCKWEKKSLYGTFETRTVNKEEARYQTIPEWCSLEDYEEGKK
jgi:hypothetical protein